MFGNKIGEYIPHNSAVLHTEDGESGFSRSGIGAKYTSTNFQKSEKLNFLRRDSIAIELDSSITVLLLYSQGLH